MNIKLFFSAIIKFALGIILVGLLVFLPAGTFAFAKGWLFMGALFIPMFLMGIIMMLKSPELLKRRLDGKEKQHRQNLVVKLSGLMFICGFVAAGLDFRFCFFPLSLGVSVFAVVLFLLSYILYAEVLRENVYLSRTVKVEEGQKVIDTGLYGIVRHPMYTATVIMFLSIPLILGSLVAFVIFLAYPFIIASRIRGEEKLLEKELDGYAEYIKKVKWRLVPFIW